MPARITKQKARRSPKRKSSNKRVKKFPLKKLAIFSFLLFTSFLFIGGFLVVNKLNKQLVGAQSSTDDHKNYYSVVFAQTDNIDSQTPTLKKLEFKIVDLENKKVTTYLLESDYIVNLGPKYGEVPVSKLLSLGKLREEDSKKPAIDFVNNTVFELFGFPVDKYVLSDDSSQMYWEEIFKSGSFVPFFVSSLFAQGDKVATTNFAIEEVYTLSKFIAALPENRNESFNITEVAFNTIDENLREMTLSTTIALEAKSVAILNASDIPGLASGAARVIKNLGGRVVAVDNTLAQFNENFVVSDNPEDLSTKVVAKAFGITKIVSKQKALEYISSNELYRSDVLLVLTR